MRAREKDHSGPVDWHGWDLDRPMGDLLRLPEGGGIALVESAVWEESSLILLGDVWVSSSPNRQLTRPLLRFPVLVLPLIQRRSADSLAFPVAGAVSLSEDFRRLSVGLLELRFGDCRGLESLVTLRTDKDLLSEVRVASMAREEDLEGTMLLPSQSASVFSCSALFLLRSNPILVARANRFGFVGERSNLKLLVRDNGFRLGLCMESLSNVLLAAFSILLVVLFNRVSFGQLLQDLLDCLSWSHRFSAVLRRLDKLCFELLGFGETIERKLPLEDKVRVDAG